MNKKQNPKTELVMFRTTKTEKRALTKEAEQYSKNLSTLIRHKLGLDEDNDKWTNTVKKEQ